MKRNKVEINEIFMFVIPVVVVVVADAKRHTIISQIDAIKT